MHQWYTQRPIAHRGYHWREGIDENSWEAIELAVEKGFAVEFDIHLSRDGVPFIHHDHSLKRMTNKDDLGTSLKARELRKTHTHHSEKGIPLLEEVLDFVQGRVPLVIELKHTENSKGLEQATFHCLKNYGGEYSLQSFHPQSLLKLKELGSEAPIGMLSGDLSQAGLSPFTRVFIKSLCLAPYIKPDYIGYQWDCISQRAPQEMRERYSIPLLAWTVRDERARRFCEKWADGIIFENIF
ncbi:MAG: glycerophosphodiester phosphodiesterase family protein [Bdellovibrionota bacterium]|nr:glycerophosphodiester phosphodiesterase family protein [Bdellovibrionota bacterium]